MTYTATLWRVEVRAVAALLVVVLIFSIGTFSYYLLEPTGVLTPIDKARRDLFHFLSVGAVLTVLYGAPLYALAMWKKFTPWYVVFIIGVAPGAGLLFMLKHEPQLALWIAGTGIAVAFLTHLNMRSNSTVERNVRKSGARPSP